MTVTITNVYSQGSININQSDLYYVNKQAVPPGGVDSLYIIIKDNLNFPDIEDRVSGTVQVKLIVDSSGFLKEPQIYRESHPLFDKEALRVARLLPQKWSPAIKDGRPVEMFYIIKMRFRK